MRINQKWWMSKHFNYLNYFSSRRFYSWVCHAYKALTNRLRKKNLNVHNTISTTPNIQSRPHRNEKKEFEIFCTQFLYFISVINLTESLICLMFYDEKKNLFMLYIHIPGHWSAEFFWEWCWKMWNILIDMLCMRNRKIVIISWNFFDWTFFLNW